MVEDLQKTPTDRHWDDRALTERDPDAVNIADVSQRELETAFVLRHLRKSGRVLEVGCGNGFLTNILRSTAAFVDAFDYSENMIREAQRLHGESNNRFFQDNLLAPSRVSPPYDCIVCVRVLINLADLEQQLRAIRNMHGMLRSRGTLILVEGFLEGFDNLNVLRKTCGLPLMQPAAVNFYSNFDDLARVIKQLFETRAEMHTGMFDVLTRVAYPLLVGAENATGHSEFHRRILPLAQSLPLEELKEYARVRGFTLERI